VEERTRSLEEVASKLETLSSTDWLTRIANSRSFDHVLGQEWYRAQRASTPTALITA
jgi:PleD family two-component response regulator